MKRRHEVSMLLIIFFLEYLKLEKEVGVKVCLIRSCDKVTTPTSQVLKMARWILQTETQ